MRDRGSGGGKMGGWSGVGVGVGGRATQTHAKLEPEKRGESVEGEKKWTGQRGTRRYTLSFLFVAFQKEEKAPAAYLCS